MAETDKAAGQGAGLQAPAAPSITVPKGGGAIRGIGEKFAANPVTGTGSMTVPIFSSPGRSGFGPQLSLSYDSGAGNGIFGFGWSLGLPHIARKTDRGLPRYLDDEESDVFLLSGAEDLVPVFRKDESGEWVRDGDGNPVVDDTERDGYRVRRYRPRIEGLFARIERWTKIDDPRDVHWRSISKDNVLTLYGKDELSRIFDPADRRRIFSWLMCETRDDKGNAVLYEYKPEDGVGVDLARTNERNRGGRNDLRRQVNRYLKRIRYGNRLPLLDGTGRRPRFLTAAQVLNAGWMFEVVFDYGEHDAATPTPNGTGHWSYRADPFSSYRAGFELRTTRLCQRALMVHHFPGEPGVGADCLVRSTDFTYSHEENPGSARNPIYTFLQSATQTGYKREGDRYLKRSLPPVEFEYTEPLVQDTVEEVGSGSLENLPVGVDGAAYRWTDLHGEGIPGILTEQAEAWFYKRNLSPIGEGSVEFAPLELVAAKPNLPLAGGQAQFMDLAGDGQPDLVVLDGPTPGLYEHDGDEGWQPFRPFTSRLNSDTRDPNLRFVDLDGDGHADVLISEDDVFVWHASLAEEGFGPAQRVAQALDEEKGPRLVFAESSQSVYLADLSGDGLTDLVRIRNSEICYWPNLGYGRFGAKVTMDRAPYFDNPDQFEPQRLRLADIDGTGTIDIIYLHRDGVRLYFNQSGNGWSEPQHLSLFPRVDELASIVPTDLLGNGTACLVWSSPLPGDARRPMRYVNLMGGQKPHLLVKTANNLGAETRVHYAPSTKFYLQDRYDGNPWITRLPFPVHVVERVETYDRISRNRFVTRYAYHHGYFDGEEREFRGFGMVEQFDTEEMAALAGDSSLPEATNIDAASHVPPVLTKTWFHTGVHMGSGRVSNFFAGLLDANDAGEYYREPGLTDDEVRALLLDDTVLPEGLTPDEERAACRALKGSMLRQEIYARDGTPKADFPYTVAEQNSSVRLVQPRAGNRHAVFFTHPREVINYHYERNSADPRVKHALTLEVDDFGNVLKEAAIGNGRRQPDVTLPLDSDREKQTRPLITYTENRVTNAINDVELDPDDYRTPLPCESRTYELTGIQPEENAGRFSFDEWTQNDFAMPRLTMEIPYEQTADSVSKQKRPIEHVRTLYRKDDLTALLPLGQVDPMALAGESYKLAFTPGLLARVFLRDGEALLPNPGDVLGGEGADRGGYVVSQDLKASGSFPGTDRDDHWWMLAGRVFLSPDSGDTAAKERAYAQRHFFLPHRYRDPFHSDAVSTESFVTYDAHDLLMLEARDALGNRVSVGERLSTGDLDLAKPGNDYRVLQPRRVMDPNRNRAEVAFDTLGMVVGTAVMGKPEETLGDVLEGFNADLTEAVALDHLSNPLSDPYAILGCAATRLVYDLFAYQRTRDQPDPHPAVVYTLARETHEADLKVGEQTKVQHTFSYSDGFGREIQKKIQAEPGPLVESGSVVGPRWVGSGWTVYNNKGKPVRQYEPFFSELAPEGGHRFEFGVEVGVSPILFYDPMERVVATLHPNHTYEKVVFDPWRQATYDLNDTATFDPRLDDDVKGFLLSADGKRLVPPREYLPTWYELRTDPHHATEFATQYPDTTDRLNQMGAAEKAAAHADTPARTYFDTLGRSFLTVDQNRVVCAGHSLDGMEEKFHTRVGLDIEGNQREVSDAFEQNGDAQGRVVMRYAYDMLGNRVHQLSMDAGGRWTLNNVAGNQVRTWNSRGHTFRTDYDPLRRPLRSFVTGAHRVNPRLELLTECQVYGEQHPEAEALNLRGTLHSQFDQAGVATIERRDFKGNSLLASRRIAFEYKQGIDWSVVNAAVPKSATAPFDPAALEALLTPLLEGDAYTSETGYDALDRIVMQTTPHTPAMQPSVIRLGYNEANLLEQVDANLRGRTANGHPVWTPFVTNINYDVKGQRQRIDCGNGTSTLYTYDPLTFRMAHLLTRRGAGTSPGDCPEPSPSSWPGCELQNLRYTYDPVGNITHIRDDAQQTIYFRNRRVDPSNDYTYDAVYRLIEASGREHLGRVGGTPIPHSHDDAPRAGIDWSANDGNAMGRYSERYVYDAVGNFLQMQHRGGDPADPGWTRSYTYDEVSLVEPSKQSNRLSRTTVGNDKPSTHEYLHDAHGSMIRMPHLGGGHPDPNIHWDHGDQLRQTDLGGGGTAYYTYDAAGERIRKVWEKSATLVEERIYLHGFEIYRRRQGIELLERETVHIMDDERRTALVETRTLDTANVSTAPPQLIRYEFGNHLGSAALELDDQAQIISYEEYTPYGSTSYQAVHSQTETPKRYRYTAKERDAENQLYYHGARYYAPWLGRWTAADPASVSSRKSQNATGQGQSEEPDADDEAEPVEGLLANRTSAAEEPEQREPPKSADINLFVFVSNSPLVFLDPDGRAPTVVGRIYHIEGTVGGKSVQYTGSTIQPLRKRLSAHKWTKLIQAKSTKITVYEVRAEIRPGLSSRGTAKSALNEAVRAVEQKVIDRKRAGTARTLNRIRAALPENVQKWIKRHKVSLGRPRVKKPPGGQIKLKAGGGALILLDAALMAREQKVSKYVMAPYVLVDEYGEFTISEQRGPLNGLWGTKYYENYVSGNLAGNSYEIAEEKFETLRSEARALYGYLDWAGDFVPGILNRELKVVASIGIEA